LIPFYQISAILYLWAKFPEEYDVDHDISFLFVDISSKPRLLEHVYAQFFAHIVVPILALFVGVKNLQG